ncbi:MAG: Hint domain-containing protein [Pseudomonadota bacterium]
MANYTIYVLDESDLSVNNPDGLDGVSQGDGSHLNGKTLTINAANWTPIAVRDDDVSFSDNDGSQVLDGAQDVDNVTYGDGTKLEAEFSFKGLANGIEYTFIGFNVVNDNPSFGSIEGIAVVGPDGAFPPVGVPISLFGAAEGPSFLAEDYVAPICFDASCPILTPRGYVPVERLSPGDLVETRDKGPMPILWMGTRRAFGIGPFAPVEFSAGAIGNAHAIRVSQQHRVLIESGRAELMFGEHEVLVPARHLIGAGARIIEGVRVHYHHLLLEEHAILDCGGAPAESFLPSDFGMTLLSDAARAELEGHLCAARREAYRPARPILRSYEASALMAA